MSNSYLYHRKYYSDPVYPSVYQTDFKWLKKTKGSSVALSPNWKIVQWAKVIRSRDMNSGTLLFVGTFRNKVHGQDLWSVSLLEVDIKKVFNHNFLRSYHVTVIICVVLLWCCWKSGTIKRNSYVLKLRNRVFYEKIWIIVIGDIKDLSKARGLKGISTLRNGTDRPYAGRWREAAVQKHP